MRYRLFGILAATFLAMASHATTLDYIVSAQLNGFDVYKVTKDGVTLVTTVPSNGLFYVWNDMAANYIYAVTRTATSPDIATAEVITYAMDSGAPKQVAKMADVGLNASGGHYFTTITGMFASPQHLVMSLIKESVESLANYAHLYHKEAGGTLKYMCDIWVPNSPYSVYSASNITSIRIDANEIYAYIDYVEFNTLIPETAIYDISTDACKQVGQIPQ